VPREASVEELIRVIRGAVRDELYCSPRVAATLAQRLALLASSPGCAKPSVEALSAREQEVLALIAEGLSNKAIAARLQIAAATAKNHVHNILDKLQLRTRVQVASLVQRKLWILWFIAWAIAALDTEWSVREILSCLPCASPLPDCRPCANASCAMPSSAGPA